MLLERDAVTMFIKNIYNVIIDCNISLPVSMGGTGGLFLGASILSFVELLYILLLRPFCDVYSRRNDDPWHRKFGTRLIEDNKFSRNKNWSYRNATFNSKVKRLTR